MSSNDLVQLIAVGHGRYQKETSTHNDDRGNWMLEEYLKTFANQGARLGRSEGELSPRLSASRRNSLCTVKKSRWVAYDRTPAAS